MYKITPPGGEYSWWGRKSSGEGSKGKGKGKWKGNGKRNVKGKRKNEREIEGKDNRKEGKDGWV